MEGDLCYKHGGTALCYKHGGTALIYKTGIVSEPITLFFDFEPKTWICPTAGNSHGQQFFGTTSVGWRTGRQSSAATLEIPASAFAGLADFTVTLEPNDPCSYDDMNISFTVVASQRGAPSRQKRISVATGGSATLTISLSCGKLTGLN